MRSAALAERHTPPRTRLEEGSGLTLTSVTPRDREGRG